MRRMAVALLAPLAVTVALAGCGGSSSAATHSSSTNSAVTVTGPSGKTPVVKIPAANASANLVTKTLTKGSGRVLTATDSVLANFQVYLWRAKTSKLLFSSYAKGNAPQVLPVTIGLSGLQQVLSGSRVGSRVMAVLPPKYGYGPQGNPQIGVQPTDTLVWVVDVLQAFAPSQTATGKAITSGGGSLPKVSYVQGSGVSIAVPKTSPPNKLVVTTLIQGTGAPVKPTDNLVVRYVGSIWRTGKVFNDDWPTTAQPNTPPNAFALNQVIKGWQTGLVGKPVGSRVMLVIPPADGYGKTGQKSVGITGTDTLVFVIDILAVQ